MFSRHGWSKFGRRAHPGGISTLDPTIKPRWLDTIKIGHGVLTGLKRVKPLDIDRWVNETYVKEAFKQAKLAYDEQKQSMGSFDIGGTDSFCKTAITRPKEAGEVWVEGTGVQAHASALCTLGAIGKLESSGKKIRASYLTDQALGIKVFADKAFYAIDARDPKKPVIVPFLLKKDAEAHAAKIGGKVAEFREALTAAAVPF